MLGTVLSLGDVIGLADGMLFLCAFINVLGLYLLFPVVRRELRNHVADLRSGRLTPVREEEKVG
ncbi:hypothetical protein N866_10605 [Actinotalea ferrariae CF5-4]|uniref:Alanine glycine permease n=1 Tax=Actinotalea ferrariae CF5-4 TaxID=948458 RepID=A0A021VTE6_9CELL|nr:hypothetical protein N866_10605 [Actinotalea ferrariae CF5-4]